MDAITAATVSSKPQSVSQSIHNVDDSTGIQKLLHSKEELTRPVGEPLGTKKAVKDSMDE